MTTLGICLGIDFFAVLIIIISMDKDIKELYKQRNADKYWNKEIKKYFQDIDY